MYGNLSLGDALDFETKDQFQQTLDTIFNAPAVSRTKLFQELGIRTTIAQNKLIHRLGLRDKYPVRQVGNILWGLSNYHDLEDNIESEASYENYDPPEAPKFRLIQAKDISIYSQRTLYRRIFGLEIFAIKLSGWMIAVEAVKCSPVKSFYQQKMFNWRLKETG